METRMLLRQRSLPRSGAGGLLRLVAGAPAGHDDGRTPRSMAATVGAGGRQAQVAQQNPTVPAFEMYTGYASYYDLPGNLTASGDAFDADRLAAAMTADKVGRFGTDVIVMLSEDLARSVTVTVNDRGPFAVGPDGRAARPLQPHPTRIIDLTPEAFRRLVGSLDPGVVEVLVVVPQ
jgi:rare lipoprotein A (peptidoglycan hydrolase)